MKARTYDRDKLLSFLAGALLLGGLYLGSRYSNVLFHSLVEAFSIVIACGVSQYRPPDRKRVLILEEKIHAYRN